jgi:hypothetical protein
MCLLPLVALERDEDGTQSNCTHGTNIE